MNLSCKYETFFVLMKSYLMHHFCDCVNNCQYCSFHSSILFPVYIQQMSLPFRVDEDVLVYFVLSAVLMQIWHCFNMDEPHFDVLCFHDVINNFLMNSSFSCMSYFVFLWVCACIFNNEHHKTWMIFNHIIDQKQFFINRVWKHWNCNFSSFGWQCFFLILQDDHTQTIRAVFDLDILFPDSTSKLNVFLLHHDVLHMQCT